MADVNVQSRGIEVVVCVYATLFVQVESEGSKGSCETALNPS